MNLKEQIDQLERKCKRLTLAVTGMMVIAVAAVCIAAKPNPNKDGIQASKLEIVDEEGNVRIRLGRADAGYGIIVYDSNGKFGATLTNAPLGAGMQLRKDGGSIKMLAMKQGCGITIRDTNGNPRAMMLQNQKGSQLILKDRIGKNIFSAPE
jgi:hypothetical protein